MSSQKGITKLQLDVTYKAIILHFCKIGKAQNPYTFIEKLLLQNNPEVNVAKIQIDLTIGFYLYQRDAFENDKIQWLDQYGSLLHLLLDYFVVAISQ
jgi:hypothetical protein